MGFSSTVLQITVSTGGDARRSVVRFGVVVSPRKRTERANVGHRRSRDESPEQVNSAKFLPCYNSLPHNDLLGSV